MLRIYLFYVCSKCSSNSDETNITNKTSLSNDDGPECKKTKSEEDQNMTQYNYLGIHESILQFDVTYKSRYQNSIVPETSQEIPLVETQNNQACSQLEYVKETEIFNNHKQQKTHEVEQDVIHKIVICKNIKKNTKNFIDLTEETKKPLYNEIICNLEKHKKIKILNDNLKKNKKYKLKNYMEQDAIRKYKLAEYMPVCITKYAYNKEIFDKQTEAIRTLFVSGFIDFDMLFEVLNREIYYDDNDKEMLAELVDIQMNDFLHTNIDSLTLLFPKMQFFMEYYNKYQDDLVFFEDTKHVCMVYGMMHTLETIMKCTEHMVDKMKGSNNYIIACSNGKEIYSYVKIKPHINHYLVTKFEIEKMLLYILQPFLPTDHFIDLVNLFHIEFVSSFGIFNISKNKSCIRNPPKNDSALQRLSTYCYIHFGALETDNSGIQKNVTHIFFRRFVNEIIITNIFYNKYQHLNTKNLLMLNNCFSIYIRKNADTLCDKLRKTYDRLVVIHNHMQDKVPINRSKKNDKNDLQTIKTNIDNRIIVEYQKYKKYKHKRRLHFDKSVQTSPQDTCFYTLVCYILNYMCNYILSCESTFLMSYDITSDKNKIKNAIEQCMKIIEKWNDKKYVQKESLYYDLSFGNPRSHKKKKQPEAEQYNTEINR